MGADELTFDEFFAQHLAELHAKRTSLGTTPAGPDHGIQSGDRVAWTKTVPGIEHERVAAGVTVVHRCLADGITYCSQRIPPAERHFTPLAGLRPCWECERLHSRGATVDDVHDRNVRKAMSA